MRLRRSSPWLLLLLATSAIADLDSPKDGRLQKRQAVEGSLTNDQVLGLGTKKGEAIGRGKGKVNPNAGVIPENTYLPKATLSARPYVGTEDAPVDGLDGKPHAGPFVDTTPESALSKKGGAAATTSTAKAVPTSLEKFAKGAADIPEKNDGVMNDETRVAPKKGTTGTEGGISEKEKARKAKGQTEKEVQSPKEAPPLPHSEQERIAAEKEKASTPQEKEKARQVAPKDSKPKDSKPAEKGAEAPAAKKEGAFGLEKPTDLPDTPHNIPHPDPKGPSMPGSEGGSKANGEPPVGGTDKKSWLQETMPYTEGQPRPKTLKPLSDTTAGAAAGAIPAAAGKIAAGGGEMEWHEWFHSFVLSLTMILFSEIGDKTFLIAALMAMRHPRLLVFSAAFGALIAMTILSAVLGHAVPTLLPKRFTTFAAAVLFLVFGARGLREGLAMSGDEGVGEEMREVEAELEEKEHSLARHSSRRESGKLDDPYTLESGRREPSPPSSRSPSPSSRRPASRNLSGGLTNLLGLVLSPAWVQTFIMTFLGEWGDRSQIATIAMAAGQDYWWVTLGAITGHACCTGLAVVGGRALAGRVSMRVVTIGGAVAFLVFGVIYMYECIVDA
ncbi:GCR1-dependent translation factor 1 [Recurvomyces mirabilis]|uniref:GCR1-dependent translation factor 1 n=1 Tax=Recurvomyces mirabilis TaxID=574656 RepID=A0AAE0WWA0_9PEZI|nr:GCR1-dependent translation factor 1 [Recurvomyces mirabilis]KAK5159064.1 GCR1-dependent translation factor 1 [Recurvomyces mirabilis]